MLAHQLHRAVALLGLVVSFNIGWQIAEPIVTIVREAHASKSWPRVAGTIVAASIRQDAKGRDYPALDYRYRVGERSFEGGAIALLGWGPGDGAADMLARYPLGPVEVFYKPDEPGRAVLVPGLQTSTPLIMLAAIGSLMALSLFSFARVLWTGRFKGRAGRIDARS